MSHHRWPIFIHDVSSITNFLDVPVIYLWGFLRQVSAAVTEAVIAAHTKSSQYMKEKMGNLTKGK